MNLGIIFAFVALVAWALDDFFIARNTRRFGDWFSLAFIAGFGLLALTPLVWHNLLDSKLWLDLPILGVLVATGLITVIAAVIDFEALRRGKLAVVDSIYALEIPVTFILTSLVIKESLSLWQLFLIFFIFAGLMLVAGDGKLNLKKLFTEKGARLAIVSAVLMGGVNFFTGFGARLTNAFLINWFVYLILFICSLTALLITHQLRQKLHTKGIKELFVMSFADVIAWTSFAYSASLIPIALTTAISEGYIALAAVLGIFVNHEKIKNFQKLGIGIVLASVIILSLSA